MIRPLAILSLLTLAAPLWATDPSLASLDAYLQTAREVYQHESHERADMLHQAERFERQLADLIHQQPDDAVPRFVYYMMVDIGRYIHLDTPLGLRVNRLLGETLPSGTFRKQPAYLTAHVYAWWQQNAADYPVYQPLQQWLESDYARQVAIPAYQRQLDKEAHRRRFH